MTIALLYFLNQSEFETWYASRPIDLCKRGVGGRASHVYVTRIHLGTRISIRISCMLLVNRASIKMFETLPCCENISRPRNCIRDPGWCVDCLSSCSSRTLSSARSLHETLCMCGADQDSCPTSEDPNFLLDGAELLPFPCSG